MKTRYRMVRYSHRGGTYYSVDRVTGSRESLDTKDPEAAQELICAKNEASRESAHNLQKARIYINASDPDAKNRTWDAVLAAMAASKPDGSENQQRLERAAKDPALDTLRSQVVLETSPDALLKAMKSGTVSTNVFLRRVHNYCIGMNWRPCAILPKKLWPAVKFKSKRAITKEEHDKFIARETNTERHAFYELCWELGGSQSDVANLSSEDVDWDDRTICYNRRKLASLESTSINPPLIRFGKRCEAILRSLPQDGPFFPYLRTVRACDRMPVAICHRRHHGVLRHYQTIHNKGAGCAEAAFRNLKSICRHPCLLATAIERDQPHPPESCRATTAFAETGLRMAASLGDR